MPQAALLGPVVLPLVAAGAIVALGAAGIDLGRPIAALGAWGSVAAVSAIWIPVRSSQELNLGQLGFGSSFDLRIDAVAFAFGLMITVPAAVLLTLQPRTWQEASLAVAGVAAAMGAVEAGGVVLTAIFGGTAAALAVVLLDTEDPRAPRPRWSVLLAAWLALGWVGVILQVYGGTAVYSAVPVSTVTSAVFALLAVAALMASGLFPWRPWPSQLWPRPSLRAAAASVAILYPLGFYLLVRAFELGDGRYPQPIFNGLLASLGVLVALGAAVRAQAAETRREFLGEVVPAFGGFALMSIAIGTPLGLAAGLITLATGAALTACLALLPDRAGPASLLAIAAAVGLPPGLAFAARVVGIESTFEAGDFAGLIGVAGLATWALWTVAAARAVGLPAGRGHAAAETLPRVAGGIAVLTLLSGPALAVLQVAFADPAQSAVMSTSAGAPGIALASIATVTTVLPVVTLFVPLLLIGVLVYSLSGTAAVRAQARPPVFAIPFGDAFARARQRLRAAAVPEQYRSIFSFQALESAATGGRPLLWLAAVVALAAAVIR